MKLTKEMGFRNFIIDREILGQYGISDFAKESIIKVPAITHPYRIKSDHVSSIEVRYNKDLGYLYNVAVLTDKSEVPILF